jgi:hypothetical protein
VKQVQKGGKSLKNGIDYMIKIKRKREGRRKLQRLRLTSFFYNRRFKRS